MDDIYQDIKKDIDVAVINHSKALSNLQAASSIAILYADKKPITVYLENMSWSLSKGDCIVLGGGFAVERVAEPGDFLCLALTGELLHKHAEKIALAHPLPLVETGLLGTAVWTVLARNAEDWTEAERIKLAFDLLIALLDRPMEDADQKPLLVLDACALMEESYGHIYGVEDLAERLEVSKAHLIRAFRSEMHMTPGDYLKKVRMENAKRFLVSRELDLNMIAGLTGYANANYFGKVFKKTFGISPKTYQQMAAERQPLKEKELPAEIFL